ncbi:acyltransferase [Sinomonas sp. ASV322]|uniref:acyltransferase family protein n=1 Tax=Sinomonas sp. ASV322 TaxID=3041920 RepID=UPI0027DCFC44|nr:acyltransferase [Sinomonas sp. ASV322]MDQ4503807.1 acyltransferase [Sinomonas sp. ASV322]
MNATLMGSRSLGSALGPGTNSLNALRLLFAACVIVSHAWWLGGYGPEPALYGIKLGTAGVMGFFAISGYLITVSAERSTPLGYVLARLARIYPAMAVSALLVAFLAAPIGALITRGRYSISGALAFLESALGLGIGLMNTPPIGSSLLGNHDRFDWDGPLWTLTWEALCYVVVGLAVFLARRFSKGRAAMVIVVLFAAATGALLGKILAGGYGPNRTEFVLPFIAIFMASALLATMRDRVRVGAMPAVAAGLAVWGALATGQGTALAPLPFSYLVLWLGSLRVASRVGSRFDISYGVYLYGWPVQQLLAAARVPLHVPPLGYAALALVLVWPLGFLSCVVIEHPAQKLRRAIARSRDSSASRIAGSESAPRSPER